MIQNLPSRRTLSLGGRWRTIVDPYESGYRSPWGDAWPVGWFRNLPIRPGLAEYDFSRADLLDVPGDWNSQDDRLFFYEGSVWYALGEHLRQAAGDERVRGGSSAGPSW